MVLKKIVLNCEIIPNKKTIDAFALLKFDKTPDKLLFLLNPDLSINDFYIKIGNEKIVDLNIEERENPEDSFLKTAKLWEVQLPSDFEKPEDESFQLVVSYSGKILKSEWDLSRIEDNFVELASYGVWYPLPLKAKSYTYELTLTAPKEWTWIANADLLNTYPMQEKLAWSWKNDTAILDITLLGMPKELMYEKKESIFWGLKEIVNKNATYEKQLLEMTSELKKWLGALDKRERFVYAFTPREKGGQYSRDGLIVTVRELPTDKDMISRVLQGMLHEVSHFWWKKTSVYEYHNWLDEALAEITSSLIIAEKFESDEWLENRANRVLGALEKAGNLPSIRNTPRIMKDAYVLFYYRGFLLFYEILKKMGKEQFKKMIGSFARSIQNKRTATTEDFLNFLSPYSTEISYDLEGLVNKWLDYKGIGIPK
ncbi:MAG: hypothetical protein FK730_15520 [Asgard group archaeon]|nr:hypothetical protein [Asgard group archaeon]